MELTRTAFGTWNGGRFMPYGEPLPDDRWVSVARHAWHQGIRTFVTADVHGGGHADVLLGRALSGFPRDSYCLVGAVGYDIYTCKHSSVTGFPRFTNPQARRPQDYADYLRMATEKSLERCGTDRFDLLLLQNPDLVGYTSDFVWNGLQRLADAGLTARLGIAPGPGNGFTLDLIQCFERFGALIDWAMLILHPMEPWPGSLVLPAAVRHDVRVLSRVVDAGGCFHDDVQPGHVFGLSDLRANRPSGWIESAQARLEAIRPIAARYGLTLRQFAGVWTLQQAAVQSVLPTLIQELGTEATPIESKVDELATLPEIALEPADLERVDRLGDNRGSFPLQGASRGYRAEPVANQWSLTPELEALAQRWQIDPDVDLAFTGTT